jgi:hypothetical protein
MRSVLTRYRESIYATTLLTWSEQGDSVPSLYHTRQGHAQFKHPRADACRSVNDYNNSIVKDYGDSVQSMLFMHGQYAPTMHLGRPSITLVTCPLLVMFHSKTLNLIYSRIAATQ